MDEKIGRKIYYDKDTGNLLVDTGEKYGFVSPTTVEQDFETYATLSKLNPETVGMIELEYGELAEDFLESSSFRVNPTTLELEFSYVEQGEPPAYQEPLSVEVQNLKKRLEFSEIAIDFLIMNGGM